VRKEASSPWRPPLYKLSFYIFFHWPLHVVIFIVVHIFRKNTFFFSLHFVGLRGAFVVGLWGIFLHYNELFQQHSIGMLYFSFFVLFCFVFFTFIVKNPVFADFLLCLFVCLFIYLFFVCVFLPLWFSICDFWYFNHVVVCCVCVLLFNHFYLPTLVQLFLP